MLVQARNVALNCERLHSVGIDVAVRQASTGLHCYCEASLWESNRCCPLTGRYDLDNFERRYM